jgi:hypothetical protein
MAVSRNTEHSHSETVWQRVFSRLSRHDLLLTAIPLVFVTALVAATLVPVPMLVALGASALTSTVLLTDALFVHPPVDAGR